MSLEEVKAAALEMLVFVDGICNKNGLRYSIFYGTLLGAVRHGGFIPWDDDIDIVMPRKDYLKLIDILKNDSTYLLASPYNRTPYRYTFSKIFNKKTIMKSKQKFSYEEKDMGVFIDIFPLDGLPQDKVDQRKIGEEADNLRLNFMNTLGMLYARSYSYHRSFIKLLVKYPQHKKLLKKGDYSYWREKYELECLKYTFEKSDHCGHLEYVKYDKAIYPTEWFDYENLTRVKFEGYDVMSIKNSKEFLTQYYGSYMELPPQEERLSNHLYRAYWK